MTDPVVCEHGNPLNACPACNMLTVWPGRSNAPAGDALAAAEWLVRDLPQPPGQPTALEILRAAFAAARAEGAAEEREACARCAALFNCHGLAREIRARSPSSGTEAGS